MKLNYIISLIILQGRKEKCLSKWKNIDVRPVTNKEGVIGYLNKETNPNHISFDFINSIPVPIKNN